jgi:uncharacterized membrane protein YqjE
MNRALVLVGGIFALIGLIVNVALDFDNIYDMTMTALWVLVLIFALAGALAGGKKQGTSSQPKPTA